MLRYYITNKININLLCNWSWAITKEKNVVTSTSNYSYKYNIKINTFQTQFVYLWVNELNKEKINFYSGISLGAAIVKANTKLKIRNGNAEVAKFNEAESGLAYQVILIGHQAIFGKHFGCFAELGYGFNGILNAGASWTF